jgi:hypothetical protein
MNMSASANPGFIQLSNPSSDQPVKRFGRALVLLVLLASGASALRAQYPNTVRLAPETCPEIRDGDIVAFTFVPSFDVPSAVSGLRNVSLRFVKNGVADPAQSPGAEFTLHAVPQRGEHEAPESSMVANPDGSISFRFRANLRSTGRGTYFLVGIMGEPVVARGYSRDTPKIINAPLRQRLCLQVAPPY